jgi:[protein-PII] uridylyltransferase
VDLQSEANPSSSAIDDLRSFYVKETLALEQSFSRTGDGIAAIRRRSSLVDATVKRILLLASDQQRPADTMAAIAVGGYGRKELFPYSDVDILYLFATPEAEEAQKEFVRRANQVMWDIGLRASPVARALKECERFHPGNVEFTLSLLDARFVTGDESLAGQLQSHVLPSLIPREWARLTEDVAELARSRHKKYGDTIFQLEPNIKESPGGLRDHNLAHWLQTFLYIREHGGMPGTSAAVTPPREDAESAFEFLAAARCFLHLRNKRDDNVLSWNAQDEAAAQSIGLETAGTADPAYWMRTYYRHARAVYRRVTLMLDSLPATRLSFYRTIRRRRTPIPGTDFFLEDGRIDVDDNAPLTDADAILRLFCIIAVQGHSLSQRAEDRIAEVFPMLDLHMPEGPFLWNVLREILLAPHAAHALRSMHALGILEMLIPEFHGIDALVVRDSYHRYTVDEHTFVAIHNVHLLRQPSSEWEHRFASLVKDVDRLDLFLLAILMHDTGKARRNADHTVQSVELADGLLARLDFDPEERQTVRRLIRNHLEMSLTLRRDIFDPETVRSFAEKTGSQMYLRMLTLMTYADIRAVHPDALTPWKAENLWQLYIATSNFMDRSVDEERFHVKSDAALHRSIAALVPEKSKSLVDFLNGLPQRYLQTRRPDMVRDHFEMSLGIRDHGARVALRPMRQLYEMTLVTQDRPKLFADVAGAFSAWGMNIIKADAFSNDAGTVVDTFLFADIYGTLELNPSEIDRFQKSVASIASLESSIEPLLRSRRQSSHSSGKLKMEPRLEFDNESSTHSTLLQIVAPDAPGLLRRLALVFAESGCNIKVALIDTEGQVAVDVFYLDRDGQKLDGETQHRLAAGVYEAMDPSYSTSV